MRFKIADDFGKPEYVIDTLQTVKTVDAKQGEPLCLDVTLADGNGVTQPSRVTGRPTIPYMFAF